MLLLVGTVGEALAVILQHRVGEVHELLQSIDDGHLPCRVGFHEGNIRTCYAYPLGYDTAGLSAIQRASTGHPDMAIGHAGH